MRNCNIIYSFISPVTGRILSTYNYVLIGNNKGIATPSPLLIDTRLDLLNLKTTLNNCSIVSGFPNSQLPNAQVLSNLEDGVMINTGGIVSTANVPPIPTQATYIIQVPDSELPEAQALSLLGVGIAKIIDNGVIALAIADEDYASFSTIESYTEQALEAAAEAQTAAAAAAAFAGAAASSATSAKASATIAATSFAGVSSAATISQSAAITSKHYANQASSAASSASKSAKLAQNAQIKVTQYANLTSGYTKQSLEYANKSADSANNSAKFSSSASTAAISSSKSAIAASTAATSASVSASSASGSATSASVSASSASDSATSASTSASSASDSATAASTSASSASDSATDASTSASSASDSATAASVSASSASDSATSASTSASSASDSLTIILNKLNYGALYLTDNTDITYITANTYTKLIGTTSIASVSSLFESLTDNRLNYTGESSVNVFITANISIFHNVTTGTTIGIGIYKNGVQLAAPITTYQSTSNHIINLTVSVYALLNTNDYIEVWGSTTDNSECVAVNMNFLVNLI